METILMEHFYNLFL